MLLLSSTGMFASYKCTRILSRKVRLKNLLKSYCYFSQESNAFVKKARNVESLKLNGTFPPSACETGKYILLLKRECVCVDKNNKLLFRDFKDVEKLRKLGNVITTFLDILTDSDSEVYLFAANLQVESDDDVKKIDVEGEFVNIRQAIFFLNEKEERIIHHARSLFHFHKSCQFCNLCGASLEAKEGGFHKLCPNCKFIHYPQVAPIGITLVEDRDHKEVLLVRQERHPPGMYSCVAGFIEPGESLEENAAREVAEEVGLKISNVEYCLSQHWAAPSSQLILGCIGTALHKNASIDEKEILAAKWVTAEELKEAVKKTRQMKSADAFEADKLWAPASNTVSHSLMLRWLKKYHNFEPGL